MQDKLGNLEIISHIGFTICVYYISVLVKQKVLCKVKKRENESKVFSRCFVYEWLEERRSVAGIWDSLCFSNVKKSIDSVKKEQNFMNLSFLLFFFF